MPAAASASRPALRSAGTCWRIWPPSALPAGTIAGYEPLRTEPGSTELLPALAAAGYRVIVPITLPDRDLDWRQLADRHSRWAWPRSPTARAGSAARLRGRPVGNRLGRGGGSYDRALARIGRHA